MKRRAVILAALVGLTAATTLALAPDALALGGGGSSSVGGGGGGGGGGHGGSGFFIYIILRLFIDLAIHQPIVAAIIVGLALAWYAWVRMTRRTQAAKEDAPSDHVSKRKLDQRERRVELAAAEAAEDDPAFAPDEVRASAAELFRQIEAAWDARDRTKLGRLVGPDLMKEWTRRLDDFQARGWHNRVQPLEEPRVDYVGLSRGGDDGAGRVVVRMEARMKDYVDDGSGRHIKRTGYFTETVRLQEYWTLARVATATTQNGKAEIGWILVSIEQAGEGKHALQDKIVGTAWADEGALRDEALVEGAVAEAVPSGTKVSEVAELQFEGDAHSAANDLSVADGRFAPDVLEVAARRAVAAWAEAVDGDDAALSKLADPKVVQELLYPNDPSGHIRLVVRGPKVNRIRVVGLDAGATPPTMTIEVDVQGHRYLQDRDTAAVVGGSKARSTGFTERWTFALSDDERQPWRICAAGSQQPTRA